MAADGFAGGGFDIEAKGGGKANCAQDTHGVFGKTLVRIANDPDHALFEVAAAMDVVDDGEVGNVVEERIDGEIAAQGIFFGCAEQVVAQDEAVFCQKRVVVFRRNLIGGRRGGAERGDFDDLVVKVDVGETEAPSDQAAVAEYFADFFGRGVGGDVKIFRVASDEQVAHAAAGEVSEVTGILEPVKDFKCRGADLLAADVVVGAGYDLRFHRILVVFHPPSPKASARQEVRRNVIGAAGRGKKFFSNLGNFMPPPVRSNGFSDLILNPAENDADDVGDLFLREFDAGFNAVKFFQFFPVAGSSGVLGNKDGVTFERSLSSVILGVGRGESFIDEVGGVQSENFDSP